MKKYILLTACLIFTNTGYAKIVRLTSQIIHIIDGSQISAPEIKGMLQVRAAAKRIRSTTRYTVNDESYTVAELVQLEQEEAVAPETLQQYLSLAQQDFQIHIAPFLENAEDMKRFMFGLIEEWSDKGNHADSLLLLWGNAAPGTEEELFKKEIINLQTFDNFCADLMSFLETVVYSCPKAIAEFRKQIKEYENKS